MLHKQRKSPKKSHPWPPWECCRGGSSALLPKSKQLLVMPLENPMPKEQFAAHGLKDGPPTPDSRTWVQPLQNHFVGSLLLGKKKKEKREEEKKRKKKKGLAG